MLKYYLLSLAVSDLLAGCMVTPLSVYPALVRQWVYGDQTCRLVGYLMVTLWATQAYTLMWIGVDRYLAITKPLRYETTQTKVRCGLQWHWQIQEQLSGGAKPTLLGGGLNREKSHNIELKNG